MWPVLFAAVPYELPHPTHRRVQEAEDAIEASMRSMGETYVGVKHTQVWAGAARAPYGVPLALWGARW